MISCPPSNGIRRVDTFSFGEVPEACICLTVVTASALEAKASVSFGGGNVLEVSKSCECVFGVAVIGAEPASEEVVDFEDLGRVR